MVTPRIEVCVERILLLSWPRSPLILFAGFFQGLSSSCWRGDCSISPSASERMPHLSALSPLLVYPRQGLYSFCDDDPLFPHTDRAPTNRSPGRVRSAKDRFPLADQIALRILGTGKHAKETNAGHSHFKKRMHRLQYIRQTLKEGMLSVGQFGSKPQHNLIAVVAAQGLGKK